MLHRSRLTFAMILTTAICVTLLGVALKTTPGSAATFTANWTSGSGQWTDAGNWSTADYPHNNLGNTYDVNTGGTAITITVNGDVNSAIEIEKFTLGGTTTNPPLVLSGTGTTAPTITVNDVFNWNRADLTGTGKIVARQGIQFNLAGNYWNSNTNSWDIDLEADSTYAFYPSASISDNRNFTNTGTITVKNNSTLALASRRQILGNGTIAVEAGSQLTYASPFATPNNLGVANTLNNSGTVQVLNNGNAAALTFSGGGTHAGGTFQVASGTSLTLNGTHTITNGAITGAGNVNLASISLDAGSTYNVTGNTTISGNSSFSGSTTFQTLTIQNGSSTPDFSGDGDVLINGDFNFGGTGRGARLLGSGTVTVMGDFTFGSGSYTNYALAEDRTLELYGNSTYEVYPTTINLSDNNYQMDIHGTIVNKSGAVWTMLQSTRPMRGNGTFINEAGAVFQKTAGVDTPGRLPTIRPAFVNAGTVTNSSGTLQFLAAVAPFTQTDGRLIVNNAPLIMDGVAKFQGGTIEGVGTLTATVDAVTGGGSGLTISPGMSIGTLNISGSVTLDANDTILLEIANGTSYDVLNISGTLTLGNAELDLSFLNGFSAEPFDELVLITAGNLNGTFSNAPAGMFLFANYYYSLSYDNNQVTLSNFAMVPEPSSLCLLAGGLLAAGARRRRKNRSQAKGQGLLSGDESAIMGSTTYLVQEN